MKRSGADTDETRRVLPEHSRFPNRSNLSQNRSPSPMPQSSTDRDCVRLAKRGDRSAQEELVRRYMPIVFRLCSRLLSNSDAASDATQEVFLRAFSGLETCNEERSFRSWLCAIAWNLARDHYREKGRRRKGALRARGKYRGAESSSADIADAVDTKQNSIAETFERRESHRWIHIAMKQLDPSHRALLLLRETEGLSYAELVELTGMNLGTVKSRLHRARMELKAQLLRLSPELFKS